MSPRRHDVTIEPSTNKGGAVQDRDPAPRLRIHWPTWSRHPGVRSGGELTAGERAADRLRNGMGSWGFVLAAFVFLAGWMIGNSGRGFDRYPFILLNLILSCLAAMQGAILLIAAKREDQISSELARHDLETNLEADRIVKEIHTLTREIHACTVADSSRPDVAYDSSASWPGRLSAQTSAGSPS
jgi:uncharacterized membrane protein